MGILRETHSEGGIARKSGLGVGALCSRPCVWFILLGNQFSSSFQSPRAQYSCPFLLSREAIQFLRRKILIKNWVGRDAEDGSGRLSRGLLLGYIRGDLLDTDPHNLAAAALYPSLQFSDLKFWANTCSNLVFFSLSFGIV